MAAGGPQMLATSNVCGVDAAVRHALSVCLSVPLISSSSGRRPAGSRYTL